MKIAFCDFWDGFEGNNNFFLDLFKSITSDVELSSPAECDILIYSCFGNQHKNYSPKDKIKIFYTGENLRPNFEECTYSFTFDFESYKNRNIRIPLWLMQIDWFNKKDYGNPKFVIPPDEINDNQFIRTSKDKFCCTVFNTVKQERVDMYNGLSEYKKVDGYGKPFGNWAYGEDAKYSILSRYKFSICFENTVYPGYFTEKLIHAKVGGTIPIYSGDLSIRADFNPKSFLNLQDFGSVRNLIEEVKRIDSSDTLIEEYRNEKLFEDDPQNLLDRIKNEIKYILNI